MSVTKMNTVTLSEPVTIEGEEVSDITLRKPQPGELRGLSMIDILRMETDAMIKLLPRITQPPLTALQVSTLEPEDFADMAVKTTLFFAKKEQLEGQVLELQANP
ncbi:phage tail assembly protein [Epibacterium ulvae]|uniref:phage tail assembly protein n=1 Tax=Epibacterium ulvae TaxID=1156985 RepID=UPI0024934AD9|nr:phage tail assembly protein [Epibacterium ulvae]